VSAQVFFEDFLGLWDLPTEKLASVERCALIKEVDAEGYVADARPALGDGFSTLPLRPETFQAFKTIQAWNWTLLPDGR
jgi:hypothetical protein